MRPMSCAGMVSTAVIRADGGVCSCAAVAHSSYDFLFAKPAMRWLLNDYMNPGYRGWLHFRPAEDLRLSVSADLHGGSTEQLGRDTTGVRCPVRLYIRASRPCQCCRRTFKPHAPDSDGHARRRRALHVVSSVQRRPFVPLVCAQIPLFQWATAAQAR